jgi:methyl-accepting chemotaxis protein
MFKGMRVATKLALGFGLVIAMLLLVSLVGISRMQQLNQAQQMIVEDLWPKTKRANEQAASVEETSASIEQMTASITRTPRTPRSPTAWPTRPPAKPPKAAGGQAKPSMR